jgi:hypothetical protein
MSLLLSEVKDIIYDWVVSYSIDGCFTESVEPHVIWAEQTGEQPEPPYITLKVINNLDVGVKANYTYENDTLSYHKQKSLTLSVNMYGSDAMDVLTRLDDSLSLPEVRQYFIDNQLSPYDTSGVKDITVFLDTVYESRANLDIFFYYARSIVSKNKNINTIETPVIN